MGALRDNLSQCRLQTEIDRPPYGETGMNNKIMRQIDSTLAPILLSVINCHGCVSRRENKFLEHFCVAFLSPPQIIEKNSLR